MAVMLVAVACSEVEIDNNPPQSPGRTTLELSSESTLFSCKDGECRVGFKVRGGKLAIDVVTNAQQWSYTTIDAEWLEIDADDYFLYLVADTNTLTERRSATIVVSAEGVERTVNITQNCNGDAEIELSIAEHNFMAHTELVLDVEVECSVEDWSVETNCSWLLVQRTEQGLKLTADDNSENMVRSTEIEVVAGMADRTDRATLRVTQDGNAFIVVSSHNVAADDEGGVKHLMLRTNEELEWDVENLSAEWFTVAKQEGGVAVTVASNMGGNERRGSFDIVVGDKDNSAKATISVLQIGPDTEELIYEIEITVPDTFITAAPVLSPSGGGQIQVDWGDGSEVEEFIEIRGHHTYAEPGLYTITITGEAKSLEFGADNAITTELRNIISWGTLGYTTAADMCLGCAGLESIPNDVAGSFANVKSFNGAFSCCESLREIPAGLFRYATAAKRFEDCFSHSAAISEIPADLFKNCTAAEDLSYAFYATGSGIVDTNQTLTNFSSVSEKVRAGKLKSIPEDLFTNCPNITQLDYVFGATAIESIPADIFASASLAEKFTGAFSACVCLKEIPYDLMAGATAALDIKYMFAGCSAIEEIPSGVFRNNAAVTNLEYIFYKTGVSTLQQGIFEGLTGVKTIGAVFQDCKNLTTIEEGVFDGLTSAKSFRYCFADCTSLRTIPAGLLRDMTLAYEFTYMFHNTAIESVPVTLFNDARDYSSADFTYMFSECPNLKTVPAGLFDRFTKVTSPGYRNLFDSSGIETIPAGLFAKSTVVSTGFESLFENCPKLHTIEGSIFGENSGVSSIGYMFCNCPELKNIPEDLFAPFGEAKLKFTATFAACSSLEEIPAGLFATNTKAKQFSETFADCTSLREIPAGLLDNCPDITTVKGMFHGCTSLESIPEGLFANNLAITSFEATFAECWSLKAIPAGLFSSIGTKTSSITFSECFAECVSLKSIPASLFDTVRRISYIDDCFYNCRSLTGESPYTIITAEDGTQTKVHLYERVKGDDFPYVPSSTSAHEACFAGCIKMTDYMDMPASWK